MYLKKRAAVLMLREIRIVGIWGRATINDHGRLGYSDLDAIWSGDARIYICTRLPGIDSSVVIGTVGLDREGPVPQPHALAVRFVR